MNDSTIQPVPGGTAERATRPKVLFLNRSYWPDAEATGQLLTELCEDLAGSFEITVLAGQPNHNPEQSAYRPRGLERRAGVTIRRVWNTRLPKSSLWGKAINLLTYLIGASWAALRLPRPEVVVVETDPPLLCLLGAVLRQWHGARLVVYLQDIYPDVAVALGKLSDGRLSRWLRKLLFGVYARADRVVVLSREMRNLLVASGVPESRLVVIPNWVDTRQVFPVKRDNPFRARHGLDDQFVVMYSGNMGLSQRLDDLLVAAELLRRRDDVRFLFVGDGASRRRLEESARQARLANVTFLPYQPKTELAASLSAADVQVISVDPRVTQFLMPSKLYGILASGTPVIVVAPEDCELSSVVRASQVGRVVPPGQPEALAEAIEWCATHTAELRAMGERGWRLAQAEYDRCKQTASFGELLMKVADPSAAPPVPTSDGSHHAEATCNGAPFREPAAPLAARTFTPPSVAVRRSAGYLKNRHIVVTGGAGFLGRPVCHALERFEPAEIFVPRSREFDLRRSDDVQRLLDVARPDVVIHLAAVVGGIGANRRYPGQYFYDNAVMGLQLMEQSRAAGVEKFVGLATVCSYPKFTPVPFREDDLWNGYPEQTNAPYGLAKKMLLVQAQAYWQQYGFNAITLLPVNLYGPRDSFDPERSHVIPALIRKVVEARDSGRREIDVWGTGQASREFLFVRDAAQAIALATEHYHQPEPVNLGSGCEISIRALAEMICDLCGYRGAIRWNTSQPDGQPRRCLDTSRAAEAFGFTASTSFRDGLIETIAWYERHRDAPQPSPEDSGSLLDTNAERGMRPSSSRAIP